MTVSFSLGSASMKDEHQVQKLKRWLPGEGRDGLGTVQFIAVKGGTRTVDVADIVAIRGTRSRAAG